MPTSLKLDALPPIYSKVDPLDRFEWIDLFYPEDLDSQTEAEAEALDGCMELIPIPGVSDEWEARNQSNSSLQFAEVELSPDLLLRIKFLRLGGNTFIHSDFEITDK